MIISMMLMEVLHMQIQFLVGGHMEFGANMIMLRLRSNVHFDVILEKLKIVPFIIGDLDIAIWEISIMPNTD